MIENIKESISDISKDTKGIILDKLRNPFINYYIFFLIIYNWDIILMIFYGHSDITIRMLSIKNLINETYLEIFDKSLDFINKRLFMPLVYSLSSFIIYPFVLKEIESFLKKITLERNQISHDLNYDNELKKAEILSLRTENKKVSDLVKKIKSLNDDVERYKSNFEDISKENDKFRIKLNEYELFISSLKSEINFYTNNLNYFIEKSLRDVFKTNGYNDVDYTLYGKLENILLNTFRKNKIEKGIMLDMVDIELLKENFMKEFKTSEKSEIYLFDFYNEFVNFLINGRIINKLGNRIQRDVMFDYFIDFIKNRNLPF